MSNGIPNRLATASSFLYLLSDEGKMSEIEQHKNQLLQEIAYYKSLYLQEIKRAEFLSDLAFKQNLLPLSMGFLFGLTVATCFWLGAL